MPDNKFIQSVLAGSIMDAGCFRALQRKIKEEAGATASFKKSVKGLKYFGGFIAKVQHNYLWMDFKLTRKMMLLQKIELEIFTAYLPAHQQNKKSKGLKQEDKIFRFIAFVKKYLSNRPQRKYRMVLNVLLHEEAMFLLKMGAEAGEPALANDKKLSLRAVPGICGAVRHVLMHLPPEKLGECFRSNAAKLLRRKRRYYSYWYDPHTPAVRILEMPALMRRVLLAVDNKKRIQEIVQHCAAGIAPEDTRAVLEHLYKMKMIALN